MTLSYLRNTLFLLDSFAALAYSAQLNVSGEAITTRFWDCCKPSCSWVGKADFSHPVTSCDKNDNPLPGYGDGTGCGTGGTAYSCSDQQPWSLNDTFSYGFAGIYLTGHADTESFWCCSCYQLDFTSDPLKGKSMIVQASNTAFDVTTTNRFSLAIPGGNTTSHDACAREFGVDQSVFGQDNSGVSSISDCDKLPDQLKSACRWRFEWFKDASYPTANFKRVVCPAQLTNKTGCIRNDEKALAQGLSSAAVAPFKPVTLLHPILISSLAILLSI